MGRQLSVTRQVQEFKHLTFTIMRNGALIKMYTLTVNPQDMSQEETARVNVIETLGGFFAQEWGRGVIDGHISGTLGYSKRIGWDGQWTDGYQELKKLRDDIYRYFLEPEGKPKQLMTSKDKYELRLYNWYNEQYFQILPRKFTVSQTNNRPILYEYSLPFVVVKELTFDSSIRGRIGG